ncbi:cytochrome c [Pontibacter sp. G13]|uniref:c-type cytochrome n=1 Tax=Pontibacter sp. G13 TaxID=3074898 RepID=UPI00288A10EB|nr:cytochrome c [Pontibacter sp. G13]WNJ16602.1 cytochrome c [Pontibacter sp. G13]
MSRIVNHIQAWACMAVLALVLTGCYTDKSKRNIEYAPNMYNSLPLEPYSQTTYPETNIGGNFFAIKPGLDEPKYFKNGLSAQAAPEGTVPRGESWYYQEDYTPYEYAVEDYDLAGAELTSPIECSEETFAAGKNLYEIYCIMCHGSDGGGQGSLFKNSDGNYPPVPYSYTTRWSQGMTEGNAFHTLTHGKGIMGSYASQLTPMERWQVICYIKKFQE